ncbi:MAG: MarR family transcriptional regulator [Mobilicoccus sp.]|nr:MarR family transcriptional regulator [Mobilicoccus sp.]
MESPWLNARSQEVWRRWLHVTSTLPAVIGSQLSADSQLSVADFSVLVQLSEHPDERCRIAELADALAWERSRLSHQLTRMQKRGLITREECLDDGRGSFAVLTAEGRDRIEQAAPGHARLVREIFFDDLSEEDLDAFDRVLSRLADRIETAGHRF